ncbi:aryl-sulfate sulfotransferase [Saprospiraceae bacterium]|nr:aryl-sulfate sulfotransferase [Saprospiraceae bacterium]
MNKIISILTLLLITQICTSQDQTVGVSIFDEEEAMKGYTFFTPNSSNKAYIVDNCGYVINEYIRGSRPGFSAYLLDNGLMLRTNKVNDAFFNQSSTGGQVELVDWNNNTVWSHEFNTPQYIQHHDVSIMPNGNILIPGWERITPTQQLQYGRESNNISNPDLWGEFIWEVKPIGTNDIELVWEWHLQDHFVQDNDPSKSNFGTIGDNIGLVDINYLGPGAWDDDDWWHCNAIDYNDELDQIVLNSRNNNETWIIDHSTTTTEAAGHTGGRSGHGGDLIFRWGNPEAYDKGSMNDLLMYGSHGHYWIEDGLPNAGKIMYFNNGDDRPQGYYSTIEMLDLNPDANGNYPRDGNGRYLPSQPEVSYIASPNPFDFKSTYLSNARQLENGNIFINEGGNGRYFEVNGDKDIVWQYINPVSFFGNSQQGEEPPNSNSSFRAYKYPLNHPAFVDKDLTPQYLLEGEDGRFCENPIMSNNEELALLNINLYADLSGNNLVIRNEDQLPINQLTLFNMMGQEVASHQIQSIEKEYNFPASTELRGIYIANIIMANGRIYSSKIYLH